MFYYDYVLKHKERIFKDYDFKMTDLATYPP